MSEDTIAKAAVVSHIDDESDAVARGLCPQLPTAIVHHRCAAAQIRIQQCIQACASSLCATPAMPSTMLNHVDG